jgi:hypothetical protein
VIKLRYGKMLKFATNAKLSAEPDRAQVRLKKVYTPYPANQARWRKTAQKHLSLG